MKLNNFGRYLLGALTGALFAGLALSHWPNQYGPHKNQNASTLERDEDVTRHAVEQTEKHDDKDDPRKHIQLSEAQRLANGISLETAALSAFANTVTLPGQLIVDSEHEARVVVPISGTVREIYVEPGAQVESGDVLAVLDSRDLAEIRAQYLVARERQTLATENFTREQGLWQKKISAEQDFLQAKKEWGEARIETQSAVQKLAALGIVVNDLPPLEQATALAQYKLRAPMAGTILSRELTVGEALASDKPVFHIANLHTVWVDLAVPVAQLSSIQKGLTVWVQDTVSSFAAAGQVLYIVPALDGSSRTASVRIVLDNASGRWQPGMFVSVQIKTDEQQNVLSVPEAAIQQLEEKSVIFVKEKHGFEARTITVSEKAEGRVVIRSGLNIGDQYVAVGSFVLKSELQKGETDDD